MTTTPEKKKSAAQILAEQFVNLMEANKVPPWINPAIAVTSREPAQNFVRRKPYLGLTNQWLLAMAQAANGYESPYWVTFNQVKQMGGKIKKGEHFLPVVFFSRRQIITAADGESPVEDDETPVEDIFADEGTESTEEQQPAAEEEIEFTTKSVRILTYYGVVNIDQVEECPRITKFLEQYRANRAKLEEEAKQTRVNTGVEGISPEFYEEIEALLKAPHNPESKELPVFKVCSYSPAIDRIHMISRDKFDSLGEFYKVWAHEAAHGTGHSSRLNRNNFAARSDSGLEAYAREELVAELGAALFAHNTGLFATMTPERWMGNTAAYIASWSKRITDNPRVLFAAIPQAEKAATWVQHGVAQLEQEVVAATPPKVVEETKAGESAPATTEAETTPEEPAEAVQKPSGNSFARKFRRTAGETEKETLRV